MRAFGIVTILASSLRVLSGCKNEPSPDVADAALDVRAEENRTETDAASDPQSELDPGTSAEAAPDLPVDDGGDDESPEAGPDPPTDGGDVDGAPRADAGDFADGNVCDIEPPNVKIGCIETPLRPTITVDRVATAVSGYTCRADKAGDLVRIRACISPPSNPCIADAGESFCAVVDISAALLMSFPPDGTLTLDGTTSFAFMSPFDYEVKPENVVYTPNQALGPTRVWMESRCFCTPTYPLTGSQTVRGGLMINAATTERVMGRMMLSATGHISPVNYRQRQIDLDTFFDVALTASADEPMPARKGR
jgi:hypothetical protein